MISVFRIGLVIAAIGIVFVAMIHSETSKIYQTVSLDVMQTKVLRIELNEDIAFYKVSVPRLGQPVFVQILDPQNNIIADKKIETISAVNYFDVTRVGLYTAKISNISDDFISVQIEVGQTNVAKLVYPGIVVFAGCAIMFVSTISKLYRYRIAQPDEKI